MTGWQLEKSSFSGRGPDRPAEESWMEIFHIVSEYIRKRPGIDWVVRSDSDTWWNTGRLEQVLSTLDANKQPTIYGQAYLFSSHKPIPSDAKNDAVSQNSIYLTGGAWLLMTKASINAFADCNMAQKCRGREDEWISCQSVHCGVHMHNLPGLFQRPDQVNRPVVTAVSIHRAVGDGRNGWEHPSYYEKQLLSD